MVPRKKIIEAVKAVKAVKAVEAVEAGGFCLQHIDCTILIPMKLFNGISAATCCRMTLNLSNLGNKNACINWSTGCGPISNQHRDPGAMPSLTSNRDASKKIFW